METIIINTDLKIVPSNACPFEFPLLLLVSLLADLSLSNYQDLSAASLVGQSAPPEMLQKLTYLVIRHHQKIKRVDTVRAYTFGVLYFVEVC